uniref:Uncharacterized protein n=1 Tax=Trichogramma kaykai TaxID=54128 RepID=A0ABD2VWK1_9HYME
MSVREYLLSRLACVLQIHPGGRTCQPRHIRNPTEYVRVSLGLFNHLRGLAQTKFLIIITLITLQLSLAGFWFLVVIPYDKLYASKVAFTLITGLMTLLYLVYINEGIMKACDQLNRNCYDSKWYLFSGKERRLIQLMILRTAKPCTLTAGPTIPMNYKTFATSYTPSGGRGSK